MTSLAMWDTIGRVPIVIMILYLYGVYGKIDHRILTAFGLYMVFWAMIPMIKELLEVWSQRNEEHSKRRDEVQITWK